MLYLEHNLADFHVFSYLDGVASDLEQWWVVVDVQHGDVDGNIGGVGGVAQAGGQDQQLVRLVSLVVKDLACR